MRLVKRYNRRIGNIEVEVLQILANRSHVEHHSQMHLQTNAIGQKVHRNFRLFISHLCTSCQSERDLPDTCRHHRNVDNDVLPRLNLRYEGRSIYVTLFLVGAHTY